ncbi:MAG TPA: polysaccharide deacetylase family protein [Kofleriaceae bacterium]
MRWLAIVMLCATATAFADEPPLTSLTDDPVLGKSPLRVDGDETHGVVAFTFDDGPNPQTTPSVIDALEKYDIPATFFIVTSRLTEKGRDVLAHELADGFTVGDHSSTHKNLKNATGELIAKEIDASFRRLATVANRPIGLFRPPYGALSGAGRHRLKELGVTEVIWSIDTLDWKAHDADKLRAKVLRMILAQNGGIVLMHDVKPITAKIIADVFDDLEAENCRRLAAKQEPIWPVSLHYFIRNDKKTMRPIPDAVAKRTAAYKAALPGRCQKRTTKTASESKPAKGDFNSGRCPVDNPLAPGCS